MGEGESQLEYKMLIINFIFGICLIFEFFVRCYKFVVNVDRLYYIYLEKLVSRENLKVYNLLIFVGFL